jgi:eukaryotic-like serine/threonine-protein kinase
MNNSPASANLDGLLLPTGWTVIRTVTPGADATGGQFSNAYVVSKDGTEGFLKAFDFSDAFRANNVIDALNQLTSAYMYERNLLLHCKEKRLRKVVVALEHGEVQVPNYDAMNGRVFYLIFHLAKGDMRNQISANGRLDEVWCSRALHDIGVGIFQVHRQMIAHQDLKPSNVLIFDDECRIADFGRASRKGYPALHDDYDVAGDRTYAPPEQLYGFRSPEWTVRRFGCDLYMLGNLAAFMFTGVNITSQLFSHLDNQFHPAIWARSYTDVLPYLMTAFGRVMTEVRANLGGPCPGDIEQLIRELCNPDISKRGHPRGIGKYDQYSLERYLSRLDILSKKVAMEVRLARTVV